MSLTKTDCKMDSPYCDECHTLLTDVELLPWDGAPIQRVYVVCDNEHSSIRRYPTTDPDEVERMKNLLAYFDRKKETPIIDAVDAPSIHIPADAHPVYHLMASIFAGCLELSIKKGKDYGSDQDPFVNVRNSEAFGFPAWVGIGMRMQDKLQRIATAAKNHAQTGEAGLANESLEDAFKDTLNYAAIALVTIMQDKEKGQ